VRSPLLSASHLAAGSGALVVVIAGVDKASGPDSDNAVELTRSAPQAPQERPPLDVSVSRYTSGVAGNDVMQKRYMGQEMHRDAESHVSANSIAPATPFTRLTPTVHNLDTEACKDPVAGRPGLGCVYSLLASGAVYACCAPGALAVCRLWVAWWQYSEAWFTKKKEKHRSAYRFRVSDKRAIREAAASPKREAILVSVLRPVLPAARPQPFEMSSLAS
jgi:hypothetical protein